ncbi:hypothetical protein LUZ61_015450 [Rhynchospora tenuis]|uniref:Uncharacterized protein n=1 Tax=Rhynchospora tenuis TaxID=198213 RepID=A0AAD5Z3M8_9POAL|nr:hypothetical protein LUZ61_015450 [Rhynchospora tenuis]
MCQIHMASSPLASLFSVLIFSVYFFTISHSQDYNAIFSFGDSLSDAGNLVVNGAPKELTTAKKPYGMTYFGKPTGRCSDGRLVVDFLAEKFGLPMPPPSKSTDADFKHGANFAITGATAMESSFFKQIGVDGRIWNTGSIQTQIQWFEDLKSSLCSTEEECEEYLSKALFVVGEFGGNDYNAPIFSGIPLDQVKSYVPEAVKAIGRGINRLIKLGARDIVVPGVLPIGCFPLYLTLYNSSSQSDYNTRTGCLRKFNSLASSHNTLLKRHLEKIQEKHPKTRIMYGDYYTATMQFVTNPTEFGFSNGALKACCGASGQGSYNFNLNEKCGEQGASPCSDPSTYVSWDGIHMTEAAYKTIADGWLKGPYAEPPILR